MSSRRELRPDNDLIIDAAELVAGGNIVTQIIFIDGARYALHSYKALTAHGSPATYDEAIDKAREDVASYSISSNPRYVSDEFYAGIAFGVFVARQADCRSEVVI